MKCQVCNKETECFTVCGAFGAISYSICEDCLKSGKEPYSYMVNYIANAGRFPEDINEEYQKIVREQLKLHNITEEKFREDVEASIEAEMLFLEDVKYHTPREF